MDELLKWYGWKDIRVSGSMIGDTIKKGSGIWEKEYTYIEIPQGYGYDNYCFLLSEKLVHISIEGREWWFSICHDMKIELFYLPEKREDGRKYKRFKMTGYELFENIFKDYEVNFKKEYEKQLKEEREARIKRDKSKIGTIICGIYMGNNYDNGNLKYSKDETLRAFFDSGKAYSNGKFSKVQNVRKEFVIMENVSKHDFVEMETIINGYLEEYMLYKNTRIRVCRFAERKEQVKESRTLMKLYPEALVKTDLSDIRDRQITFCDMAMDDIKKRLNERILKLLDSRQQE